MSLLRLITGITVTADSAQVSDVLIWLPSIGTMTSSCTNFKLRKKGTKMVIMITIMITIMMMMMMMMMIVMMMMMMMMMMTMMMTMMIVMMIMIIMIFFKGRGFN